VWLPHHLGYAGSVLVQLLALGLIALLLWRRHRSADAPAGAPAQSFWERRWPTYVGGLLIAFVAVLSYLRVGPLGVTAELGSIARSGANAMAWLRTRLEGLDSFSGCATVIKETLWSNNGVFILCLVLGSLAAALFAGDFKPRLPSLPEAGRALAGGVLMGWGAMV